ncbi:hypothetical protein [Maribacter sp. 2304DJ31-5]|uniref:hypothetical protein n=1 Tax=Maribacter sp. 2304DJ31-5 TaxID=3386273 RepID=UPI0039BCE86B
MSPIKLHAKTALIYFLLAAIFGVVLRSFGLLELPVNYKFLIHTHSHIALLGWVYGVLATILYKLYLSKLGLDKKYGNIFWFTQLTLVGMLLTFPFQGYGVYSIIFSTLFLFASYRFAWFFFKNVPASFKKNASYKCIRVALWYLIISSLGPWALGAIMNTLGAASVWYRLAIYFYLHFLYNGWMMMILFGLFFYVLEQNQNELSDKMFRRFFWTVNLGILLSFFLSALFAHPPRVLNFLGGSGALLQLMAFGILLKTIKNFGKTFKTSFSLFQKELLRVIMVLLIIKLVFQLLTAFPYFAHLAATILDFTIGYLHLTFLGVVTLGIFFFLDYFKLIHISRRSYYIYLGSFLGTESLIFYKAIMAWKGALLFSGYFDLLLILSAGIPLAILLLLIGNLKLKT